MHSWSWMKKRTQVACNFDCHLKLKDFCDECNELLWWKRPNMLRSASRHCKASGVNTPSLRLVPIAGFDRCVAVPHRFRRNKRQHTATLNISYRNMPQDVAKFRRRARNPMLRIRCKGTFKVVTSSHEMIEITYMYTVHCKYGNISETVQDRDVNTAKIKNKQTDSRQTNTTTNTSTSQ